MRMKKRVWFGAGCGILGAVALSAGAFLLQADDRPAKNAFGQLPVVTEEAGAKQLPLALSSKESQGMTVHFQWTSQEGECPHLYYTNVNGTEDTHMTSPGVPMNEEGDGWYSYTIPGADSAEIQISIKEKGYQTTLQEKSGDDWWFAAGGWYTENPYGTADTQTQEMEKEDEQEAVQDAVMVAEDSKVTVHCYSAEEEPSLYYWNALPKDKVAKWPGTDMTSDGDGWYSYTFDSTTKINVLFILGDKQTDDFTAKTGEWWYTGSEWTDKEPEGQPTAGPDSTIAPDSTPKVASTPNPDIVVTNNDFREESIYFVMTARFYDGDPSNNVHCAHDAEIGNGDDDPAWRGDFKGLIEKLDYIKALGFSAVWITPVVENASGYDFHGYHALNFQRVDPRLESDGVDYQLLIDEAHKRDMKIIQDVVLNHTSNNGEENLFPIISQKFNLGNGVANNSVTSVTNDVNHVLDKEIQIKSGGKYSTYDSANDGTVYGADMLYQARDAAMKNQDLVYRKKVDINFEGFTVTTGQFAPDCMELNTEYPGVYNYLIDCYTNYINMGVDAFRIDTVKHISRVTFNTVFLPAFHSAAAKNGNDHFYMFAEVAKRQDNFFVNNNAAVSPPYYTWSFGPNSAWNSSSVDGKDNLALCEEEYNNTADLNKYKHPTSDNALLNGNEYHEPDHSQNSGMGVIDYNMHYKFLSASNAFVEATKEDRDKYYNDSTYNVVYVDSHDYGPNDPNTVDDSGKDRCRYGRGTEAWAENMDLMFTFRGIPCLFYGSEVEFKKGLQIDKYDTCLEETGRAYFGDHIEGTVNTTDFGVYSNATGAMAETLNSPLAKHLQTLNRIRRAVPALQKGQYSTEGCNGGMAYKRRYKANNIDSYVLVTISGDCTFSGVLDGTYVDLVTGKTYNSSNGTVTVSDHLGKANMRVLVYQNPTADAYGANGKIGDGSDYLK